jgi:hypothetical protein
MAKLTAKTVEAIKPATERKEIPDSLLPGLYLVVQPSGTRSWAVRYRHRGRPRKHTLGPYPRINLRSARELGSKALRAAAEGHDVASDKKQARDDSVESVVEQFIERHINRNYRPKSAKEVERTLRVHILAAWRRRSTRRDRRWWRAYYGKSSPQHHPQTIQLGR